MRRLLVSLLGGLVLLSTVVVASAGNDVVVSFDPAAGEFPEGIAVAANGDILVGMAVQGVVKRVTPGGEVSDVGAVPGVGAGFMTGLALDADGNILAAVAGFDENHGIWFMSEDGSTVSLAVATPPDGLPNGLAFDADGTLYVSDTIRGVIYRVNAESVPEEWVSDPLLLGIIPPVSPLGFPLGINGIAFSPDGSVMYGAITEFGRIVAIEVNADGSAGAVSVVAEDAHLAGADGIVVDANGDIIVAANEVNQIVEVTPTGELTVIAAGEPLRFPASVALNASGETIYVTNFDAARMLGLIEGPAAPSLGAVGRDDVFTAEPEAPTAPGPSDTGDGFEHRGAGSSLVIWAALLGVALLTLGARATVVRRRG
jgi:sugar lactone lactonase YvrE